MNAPGNMAGFGPNGFTVPTPANAAQAPQQVPPAPNPPEGAQTQPGPLADSGSSAGAPPGPPIYPLTNAQFLESLFWDIESGQFAMVTHFKDYANPNWKSKAIEPDACPEYPDENSYFCPSSFNGKSRKMENFAALHLLVVDDVSGNVPPPTYAIETSAGKFQLGYKLDEPLTNKVRADQLHHALHAKQYCDKNGNNSVRWVRLPVGMNTKPGRNNFQHVLHVWNPNLTYTVEQLVSGLGLDAALPVEPMPAASKLKGAPAPGQTWELPPQTMGEGTRSAPQQVLDELWAALTYIPVSGYEVWALCGLGFYELGDVGYRLWVRWSQEWPDFKLAEAQRKWKTDFKNSRSNYEIVFHEAKKHGWDPSKPALHNGAGIGAGSGGAVPPFVPKDDDSEYILAQPVLNPAALYGVLSGIARAGCENTEAVPASVAITALCRFSATIGRSAFVNIGDQIRYLVINNLVVGPTAKGRKGTSAELPDRIFRAMECEYNCMPVQTVTSLSTGEGLINLIRDPYTPPNSENEIPGIADKRLYVDISEFAGIGAQLQRPGQTLSVVVRDAYDGRNLDSPSKTSPVRATEPHIVIIAGVPGIELVKIYSSTEIANGFGNRFMMTHSVRHQLVSLPKRTPDEVVSYYAKHIQGAVKLAELVGEVMLSSEAEVYWDQLYHYIENRANPPVVENLLARQSTYARVLAALLALINCERVVERRHLDCAMYWLEYWRDTALYIFSTASQAEAAELAKDADAEVLRALVELGGLQRPVSHTDLTKKLTNNYQKKEPTKETIRLSIDRLQRASPARVRVIREDSGHGRPKTCYMALKIK